MYILSRDDAHVLLEAALNVHECANKYNISFEFDRVHDNKPGMNTVNIYVFDRSEEERRIVESFCVPYDCTVWEAVKRIAKYKKEV